MAMKLFVRLALFAAVLGAAADALAQREMTREEYIATYAPLAIQQQKEYGIPASIKIAQGIIESRYGNSDLSRRSNNHFGIKCKNNWIGDTVRYDDDALQECFRRYGSIEDSYRDHSEFLKNSPRYEKLFRLDPKDYKGWAYGLKECGYATAPHYAASLIKCIEDYELYLLDDGEYPAYLAGVAVIDAVELLKEMANVLWRDADASVGDTYRHLVVVASYVNGDTARRRVLDSIFNQVLDDFAEVVVINISI